MAENNGKTKWLLWTAGVIFCLFTTWLTGITQAVVTNDKECKANYEDMQLQVFRQYNEIVQRLARIEAKLESIDDK